MATVVKKGYKFIEVSYSGSASDYVMNTPRVIRAIRFRPYDTARDYITVREYDNKDNPKICVLNSEENTITFFAGVRTKIMILADECYFSDPEKVFISIEINPVF